MPHSSVEHGTPGTKLSDIWIASSGLFRGACMRPSVPAGTTFAVVMVRLILDRSCERSLGVELRKKVTQAQFCLRRRIKCD